MLTNIIVDKSTARKSAREFKKRYPKTAKLYADALKRAVNELASGMLWTADHKSFDFGDPNGGTSLHLFPGHCDCEQKVSVHRLTVNLPSFAMSSPTSPGTRTRPKRYVNSGRFHRGTAKKGSRSDHVSRQGSRSIGARLRECAVCRDYRRVDRPGPACSGDRSALAR
ncbi:MAG: hypothetical protein M1482_08915 [Chloroflexi bacterium]|nr:hypothetical protein [Chloroflexota bacterium]